MALHVGEFINLNCQNGLVLSFDNDTFQAWDDYFTITCLPNLQYSITENWPKCVKSCSTCLPDPPDRTGLVPIQPEYQVPIGQFGSYACRDTTQGTDSVSEIGKIHYISHNLSFFVGSV